MNTLYLDIGNSFLKLAEQTESEWKILFDGQLNRISELAEFLKSHKTSHKIILSSVRKDVAKALSEHLPEYDIQKFTTSDIPVEMMDYKTPGTLGLDRFLVCLAAWKQSGKNNVIVIDAGSACTVDFMTGEGQYKGGIIMPGLEIIKQTMKKQLPELPQASDSIPAHWPGKSTMECIEWGVNGGFVMAIHGFIRKYREMSKGPKVYVTGGNAKQIIQWMDSDANLHHEKNLIWDGLKALEGIVRN